MKTYDVLDLFCGIGGIRLGLENTGRFKIVHACEIDKHACKTYQDNFGHSPLGDVTKLDPKTLPHFDVLTAGFPCQPFSMAGNRMGFEDIRGTLFFDIARIIAARKPKVVLFENVRGLLSINNGETFACIKTILKNMGYTIFHDLLNAKNFGVPQNRERVYIVALLDCDLLWGEPIPFEFPESKMTKNKILDIMESSPVNDRHYLSQVYIDGLRRHIIVQKAKGRGFGYEIKRLDDIANAVVCGGMGKERNLIIDERGPSPLSKGRNTEHIRRMTPREWARLQGFPESFKITVSETWAYKQFGNSVAVPVIRAIAEKIAEFLDK